MTAARYVGAALSASVARLPQTPLPPLLQQHSLCRCYILLFFPLLFRPALAFFDTIRKLLSTLTKHVYQTHIIFCYCFYLFYYALSVGGRVCLFVALRFACAKYRCTRVANRALRSVAASVRMQLATLSTDKGESKH